MNENEIRAEINTLGHELNSVGWRWLRAVIGSTQDKVLAAEMDSIKAKIIRLARQLNPGV